MKRIFNLIPLMLSLLLATNSVRAQAELSTIGWYQQSFPSVVDWEDIVYFDILVENTGDSIYYGPLDITLTIENDSGYWESTIYTYYDQQNPVAIFPGDQIVLNGTDSIDQLRYKAGDNTIVVWPSGAVPTIDSLITNTFVLDPDGIEEEKNDVIAISNPVKNTLTLQNNTQSLPYNYYQIYDVNGRLILHGKESQFTKIDVSNLSDGSYYLIIFDDQKVQSKNKFLKE